ncbi:UNVERIFIED_CONTAM: hypothetical protein HDU68_005545 [Siphonaria sp. JEL0065]|nr:hypothetical protein HDU68_005545 [Siphonaria sp. JEL0065]
MEEFEDQDEITVNVHERTRLLQGQGQGQGQSQEGDIDFDDFDSFNVLLARVKDTAQRPIRNTTRERWGDVLDWNASIAPKVRGLVFCGAAWALGACLVREFVVFRGGPFNSEGLVKVSNVAVSLLLAMRTKTGGDRYNEARKLWSDIEFNCLQLASAVQSSIKSSTNTEEIEKQAAISLVITFPVAVKHRLRFEYETEYTDLNSVSRLIEAILPPSTPLLSNLPLDITTTLQRCFIKNKCTLKSVTETISKLENAFGQLERIRDTPLPAAYTIHLYQITFMYLAALPLLLVSSARWFTIVVVAITTFTFTGLIAIGEEIEDPVGYDMHDLDVDVFCANIERKIGYLLEREDSGPQLGWSEPVSLNHRLVDDIGLERE